MSDRSLAAVNVGGPGLKTAALFGATGLVGSFLLRELLARPEYGEVIAFARRDPGIDHPKLKTRLGDFDTLASAEEPLQVDEVFLALGTNRRKTPDPQEYSRIDHDYPVLAAQRAREGGAKSLFLLSAIGADPASRTFYFRTKGETERDIVAMGYGQTHLFRPSMILGQRKEYSALERPMAAIWPLLNPILRGALDRYRAITAEDIARAMVSSSGLQKDSVGIYAWREMQALLGRQRL